MGLGGWGGIMRGIMLIPFILSTLGSQSPQSAGCTLSSVPDSAGWVLYAVCVFYIDSSGFALSHLWFLPVSSGNSAFYLNQNLHVFIYFFS